MDIREIRVYTGFKSDALVYNNVTYFDANHMYVRISWCDRGTFKTTYIPRETIHQVVVDYKDDDISI